VILQRAIALELDVDSLDIEIASVHRYTDRLEAGGEMYLADAHPNGAGLVDWASRNWAEILRGCLFGSGNYAKMGSFIRAARERSKTEKWRGPDLLLKGFRNRQIHGLLDWGLGTELIATMLDPSYRPGLDTCLPSGRGEANLQNWSDLSLHLARRYAASFPSTVRLLEGEGAIHGWDEVDNPGTISVVAHPLWSDFAGARNAVGAAKQWAAKFGATHVRLVDSFNLQRRMAWVRANRDAFVPCEIDVEAVPVVAATVPPVDIAVGQQFEHGGSSWERIAERPLQSADPGEWLCEDAAGRRTTISVRRMPGSAKPFMRQVGVATLNQNTIDALRIIGKRCDSTTAGALH
jgi:hypothetical protein